MSHKDLRHEADGHHKSKMHRMVGGGVDSDAASDEKMIKSAVRQHEDNEHGGKHTKLKFRDGGGVDGDKPKARLDRPGRARGGKAPKHGAHVNVIVAPQSAPHPPMPDAGGGPPIIAPRPPPPPPAPPPMMGGAPGGAAGGPPIGAMAPKLPMAPGAAPMMPPRKRGGKVSEEDGDDDSYPLQAGSHSGKGRLQKAHAYGEKQVGEGPPRRRGGRAK